jgi:hypothetical protein
MNYKKNNSVLYLARKVTPRIQSSLEYTFTNLPATICSEEGAHQCHANSVASLRCLNVARMQLHIMMFLLNGWYLPSRLPLLAFHGNWCT